MELTYTLLNTEYLNWSSINGDGRDKSDLRFGQYLWIKYEMNKFTDVFHFESTEKTYSQLLKDLYELTEK